MKAIFLLLMAILTFGGPEANGNLDVAPPPAALASVSVVVIAALCCIVVLIVLVAFFVIRAIKKNQSGSKPS